MKKCNNKNCNNPLPPRTRVKYCSLECKKTKTLHNQPACSALICSNLTPRGSDGRWRVFCSKSCKDSVVIEQQKNTIKSTWADEEKRQKILQQYKTTSFINHGVEHHMRLDSTKEKIKEHNLQKFGVDHHLKSSEVIEKRIGTCVNRYRMRRVPHPKVSSEISAKLNNSDFLKSEHITKPIWQIAEEIGVKPCWVYRKFAEHGLECDGQRFVNYSGFENEIKEFLLEKNILFLSNKRDIISPFEIDIFIPELNIAIECNGSYWHSELNGKDKNYHLNKTIECDKKSIQLIHVWEHVWENNKDLVKSMLMSKLSLSKKIYARNTLIKQVTKEEERAFLTKNHLQGYQPSSLCIGLYHNNVLVTLLSFSTPRFNKKYDFEILRYATDTNITVVGGFSKMLQYFIKSQNPKSIITYADKTISNGNVYRKNGFTHIGTSNPSYYYTKNYTKFENRLKYQKHKLQNLLENYDKNLTEWDNMQAHGFDRIWDCGNDVFILINSQKDT